MIRKKDLTYEEFVKEIGEWEKRKRKPRNGRQDVIEFFRNEKDDLYLNYKRQYDEDGRPLKL